MVGCRVTGAVGTGGRLRQSRTEETARTAAGAAKSATESRPAWGLWLAGSLREELSNQSGGVFGIGILQRTHLDGGNGRDGSIERLHNLEHSFDIALCGYHD